MSLEYLSTVNPQFAEAVLSGFGIMFGVICVSFIPIICLIVGIVIIVQKKHAEQYEMFKAGNEARKRREKLENREALQKKIVRCQCCGKQTRFGGGKCPNCGAGLELVNKKDGKQGN